VLGILCYGPLDGVFDSRKKVIVPGVLLTVACFACLALLPRPPAWLASTLLVVLCFVTSYGIVIVAHGRSLFPDRLAGRGVTTVNLAQAIGTAILPAATGLIIGGFAADAAGAVSALGYRLAFAFMGALLAGCLLVYLGVADSRPSRGHGSGRAAE
jgi:MFS family permease